jgi:preprotein translocase SecF subunit
MAVDANILIFERLKEELRAGKTLHAAIDAGFNRAFGAIFDSNVTTWITCALLYHFGAPIIKGFALTLAIGVAVSMFTAITVTRTLLHLVVTFPWARDERLFGLGVSWLPQRFREGQPLNVMGRRRVFFALSGAALAGFLVLFGMGGLKPGIDFTGGSEVQAVFRQPVPRAELERLLAKRGLSARDYTLAAGSMNLVTTTATVRTQGELAASAAPDLRERLAQVRGFDESRYRAAAAPKTKSTTATAVYVTPERPVDRAQLQSVLNDPNLKVGDEQRLLAKLPRTEITTSVRHEKDLPVWVITSARIGSDTGRALDAELRSIGGGYIAPAYSRQTIGPSIAREVTVNAFWSMALASVLIVLYLAFRFAIGGFLNGLKFGVAAVVALVHDVLFMAGAFALLGWLAGWQLDSLFIAAALAIIGYSVNDTIVIYDRTRENLRSRRPGETLADLTNRSITESFDRSINTSLTVVLVLLAILLFGGDSVRHFTVALLVGTLVGVYSTFVIASPLVVVLERWTQRGTAPPAARGGGAAGGDHPRAARQPAPAADPTGEGTPPRVDGELPSPGTRPGTIRPKGGPPGGRRR